MVIQTLSQLNSFLNAEGKQPNALHSFKRVLLVSPENYRIEYAINPYMKDESGKLKTVNSDLARQQWHNLKATYEQIGFPVSVISSPAELPDMVYAANQCFPFWDGTGRMKVILGQMRSPFRQAEVPYFERWLRENDYEVESLLDKSAAFEGNGDAVVHPNLPLIWGAYGPRTDRSVYDEISTRFGVSVVLLPLQTQDFYHLDTCFSVLNASTVVIQPEAFSEEDIAKIRTVFSDVIEVDYQDNLRYFHGNCHSPNGKDVILQKGGSKFVEDLKSRGFRVHEVDTGEFIKGGGSVFCLKMMLP